MGNRWSPKKEGESPYLLSPVFSLLASVISLQDTCFWLVGGGSLHVHAQFFCFLLNVWLRLFA